MRPLRAALVALLLAAAASAQAPPPDAPIVIDRGGHYDPDAEAEALPPLRRMVFAPDATDVAVPPPIAVAEAPPLPLLAPLPAVPVASVGRRALTEREATLAASAWAYVVRETDAQTGLVRPVTGYPYATMWDVGSMLAAVVSAHGLGLIDDAELDARVGPMLETLRTMPLYNGELPNREVDVHDGRMVALGGRKDGVGSGWSALDLGRLALWLDLLRTHYPRWHDAARAVVGRWRTDRLVQRGEMWGTMRTRRGERHRHEGRTGYEEYAASGLLRWALVADAALELDHTAPVVVEGVTLRADTRDHAFLTSDPFVYAALEVGAVGRGFEALADSVYAAQRARWLRTGEPAVFAEDALDKRPWFAYHNLVFEREPFAATTGRERSVADAPTLSAKAAIAYAALRPGDPFADRLADAVDGLATGRGLWAGRYADGRPNRSLNVNTNAVALTALWVASRHGRPVADGPDREG